MMKRRTLLAFGTGSLWVPVAAFAHHGWGGFDQTHPLYLEGTVTTVRWRNPHAEVEIDVPVDLELPADLTSRQLPSQAAKVDGAKLLSTATLPKRQDRHWTIEMAPLTRMAVWKVPEPKPGDRIAMIGFSTNGEVGKPLLRVEYLLVGDQAYALRSAPG